MQSQALSSMVMNTGRWIGLGDFLPTSGHKPPAFGPWSGEAGAGGPRWNYVFAVPQDTCQGLPVITALVPTQGINTLARGLGQGSVVNVGVGFC